MTLSEMSNINSYIDLGIRVEFYSSRKQGISVEMMEFKLFPHGFLNLDVQGGMSDAKVSTDLGSTWIKKIAKNARSTSIIASQSGPLSERPY
jgi:hypothetical protein